MSLFHDVVIGDGHFGNSACLVIELPGHGYISDNAVSYWIPDLFLGLSLTILKNTDEGVSLKTMLENKTSSADLYEYLVDILLKNIPVHLLCSAIERALANAEQDGKNKKAREMLEVLGL